MPYHLAVSRLSSNNGHRHVCFQEGDMTRNGIPSRLTASDDIWSRSDLAAKVEEGDQQPGFNAVRAFRATSWRARYLLANRGQG